MNEKPKMPEPFYAGEDNRWMSWTEEQMRAYGQAWAEWAAKVCEERSMDLRNDQMARIGAGRCAAAIREGMK